jgi:hypothetical protein
MPKELKLDRKPYGQRKKTVNRTFDSSEKAKPLTSRERKIQQESIYLICISKKIKERCLPFCSREQLLALNDYSVPELIRFQGTLNFLLFI